MKYNKNMKGGFMEYYKDYTKVKNYISMSEGYDGSFLIDILLGHLEEGRSLLELGIGSGKDLDILSTHYKVTGSDYSQVFLDIYKKSNASKELILLDARDFELHKKWDGIYSNKVLHHLTEDELRHSLTLQKNILNPKGVVMHSFWLGTGEEYIEGLYFKYYTKEEIYTLFHKDYDILDLNLYGETDENDSIYIVAKLK